MHLVSLCRTKPRFNDDSWRQQARGGGGGNSGKTPTTAFYLCLTVLMHRVLQQQILSRPCFFCTFGSDRKQLSAPKLQIAIAMLSLTGIKSQGSFAERARFSLKSRRIRLRSLAIEICTLRSQRFSVEECLGHRGDVWPTVEIHKFEQFRPLRTRICL